MTKKTYTIDEVISQVKDIMQHHGPKDQKLEFTNDGAYSRTDREQGVSCTVSFTIHLNFKDDKYLLTPNVYVNWPTSPCLLGKAIKSVKLYQECIDLAALIESGTHKLTIKNK